MFAGMYGSNAKDLYEKAIQGATASIKLKEEALTYNALRDIASKYSFSLNGKFFNNIFHNEFLPVAESNFDSLKESVSLEKAASIADELARVVTLKELVKVTKWNRVDGDEGSLLSTFPKETKREMLNTLKLIKSGVPHKYKNEYGKNIDNKIAVFEYLLKEEK